MMHSPLNVKMNGHALCVGWCDNDTCCL